MNIWIKRIIKAIAIWLLLIMIYLTLNLWFNVNIPIVSNIFGVNLIANNEAGRSITMTLIFPNWILSLACFVIAYVGVRWFWKGINKSKK